MNSFNYSFLIKDNKLHNKISKLQRIKSLLYWMMILFCIAYPAISSLDISDSGFMTITYIFLVAMIAISIYNCCFFYYIERVRKAQFLSDDTDKPFIELNNKYSVQFASIKRLILITIILSVVLAITSMVLVAIDPFNETLTTLTAMGFVSIFIFALFCSLIIVFKQMSFANKAAKEIEQIKNYFYVQQGLTQEQIDKKNSNIFTNVYENQKILAYSFPDEKLRKQIQKIILILFIPAFIAGIVIGLSISMESIYDNSVLLTILLSVSGVIFAGGIAVYVILYNKLMKKQYSIFISDREKYKYHIELADVNKTFRRKSNWHTLFITLPFIILGIVLRLTIELAYEQFFFIFLAWFVSLIVYLVVYIRKTRKVAKPIEQKIEHHMRHEVFPEMPDNTDLQ